MVSIVKPIEDRRLLAVGFALAGYLMFAVTDACAKWLTMTGLPAVEVVAVRYAGQLILAAALFAPRGGVKALVATRAPWLELARGLVLLGSTVCNFTALTLIPFTTATSIAFTTPFIICVLSVLVLGETVGWRRWLAIGTGFVGVLIIVQPGTEAFHPAIFLSLTAATLSAFYYLLTRRLAGVDSSSTQSFYSALAATICIIPFAVDGWVWPSGPEQWIPFLMIGATALIGHQIITTAHRWASASTLAPFNYTKIVWVSIASWLVFSEPPTVWVLVGTMIVIGSGLYIWLRERRIAGDPAKIGAREGA